MIGASSWARSFAIEPASADRPTASSTPLGTIVARRSACLASCIERARPRDLADRGRSRPRHSQPGIQAARSRRVGDSARRVRGLLVSVSSSGCRCSSTAASRRRADDGPAAKPRLGFGVALTLQNLLYCFIGVRARHADRRAARHRPGGDDRDAAADHLLRCRRCRALIMLAGIYYGAQYGGSTTAILVNLPGESSSVVTALDGYQMARQGRAGAALAIAALGSFFAGTRRARSSIAVCRAAADRARAEVRPGRIFLADGARPGRRRRAGARLAAQGDRHDHPRPAARPGRHRRQLRRRALHLRHPRARPTASTSSPIAMGVFGIAEIVAQPRATRTAREPSRAKVSGLWPTPRGLASASSARSCAAPRSARCSACCRAAARCWRPSSAYTLEKKLASTPERVRQGRDRGRGRARSGQQRRRADLVHPDADARHPVQRRDGADGRRHDDPGHPARPAGHDRAARRCSGA